MTIGVLRGLKELGRSVPGDVALACFSRLRMGQSVHPLADRCAAAGTGDGCPQYRAAVEPHQPSRRPPREGTHLAHPSDPSLRWVPRLVNDVTRRGVSVRPWRTRGDHADRAGRDPTRSRPAWRFSSITWGSGSRRDRVKLAGNAVGCTGSTAATPHPTCSSASSSRCSRTRSPALLREYVDGRLPAAHVLIGAVAEACG